MRTIQKPLGRMAALTLFASGLAFAMPIYGYAADTDNAMQAEGQTSGTNTVPMHSNHMTSKTRSTSKEMNIETRIKTLHSKLMITPDQEDEFSAVAQTMRDNEASIQELIQNRHDNAANMTAIDDLQSYQQLAEAHADGLQKLSASFTALYNDMSDAQKKNADYVFGHFEGHRDMPMKKHS